MTRPVEVATPHGPARITHHDAPDARAVLLLGHGAGGGVGAPDLVAATEAALDAAVSVVLVEQPYRVAGRRAPAPAAQLDTAWLAVVRTVGDGLPLLFGGRSSGARVACRTATDGGAVGVLCLAFPVHPPGKPEKTRMPELALPRCPVLVIQGENDPFGIPEETEGRTLILLEGDHSLRRSHKTLKDSLTTWLRARTSEPQPRLAAADTALWLRSAGERGEGRVRQLR